MTETPEAKKEELKHEAKDRTKRTALQAVIVTLIVGAAAGITEIVGETGMPDLSSVATAGATGALMAVAAYVQRRLDR